MYQHETAHIFYSGEIGYAYEETNITRSVGIIIKGKAMGRFAFSSKISALGMKIGFLKGTLEALMEDINGTLTLRAYTFGTSNIYSSVGYVYYENDTFTLMIFQWLGRFTMNISITLPVPRIAGAAPLPECPKPV